MPRPTGATLTRGATTLDLRGPALFLPEWGWMIGAPRKDGTDRPVAGVRGMDLGPRVARNLVGQMTVIVDGTFTLAGAVATDRNANAETVMDAWLDFVDNDDPCTVTIIRRTTNLTGTLVIEDPGPAIFEAVHRFRFEMSATLPDGRLTPAT